LKFSACVEEISWHTPTKFYIKILNTAEVMTVLRKKLNFSFNEVEVLD